MIEKKCLTVYTISIIIGIVVFYLTELQKCIVFVNLNYNKEKEEEEEEEEEELCVILPYKTTTTYLRVFTNYFYYCTSSYARVFFSSLYF